MGERAVSKLSLPRLDSVTEALSDAEAAEVLGHMADSLEAAAEELGRVLGGRITTEQAKHNEARAAVAQAHTLQALGLAAYALLGTGGRG